MRNTLRKLHAGFGDFRDLIALSLAGNPISDLAPLKDLTALQSLDRSNTQVSDLVPLLGLPSLTILHAQRCRLEDFPHQLLFGGSLQELLLTETIPPCANVT